MKLFKARASSSGKLMTKPRSKSEVLSKTTKSYLEEWTKEQIYGVRKNIQSKYLTKGNEVEDDAINYASAEKGWLFAEKNEEYFEDEYFCGTPDVILEDKIIDIKSSWDCFSFPLFYNGIPNKDYYYQLQTYMHLTGKHKAQLVYVLMNTPEELTFEENHDYTEINSKYRIKTFDIEYDEEVMQEMKLKVEQSREYINEISKAL
jgi:hypothetical protein